MGLTRNQAESSSQQAHWDAAYQRKTPSGVSWYQPTAGLSMELTSTLALPLATPVIDVGSGASTFLDGLLDAGYSDITVLDLSRTALDAAKSRVGPDAPVKWIHSNLLTWVPERTYGLWHDRAVFHFLTDSYEQTAYLEKLGSTISRPGYAILATFAHDGPERCSGLPVARYGVDDLTERLGSVALQVIAGSRQEHTTPSGAVQPFTWVVARAN